jgi:hypothetical protein
LHPSVFIGQHTTAGANIAVKDGNSIERTLFNRPQAGIGFHRRVPMSPVERSTATIEVPIFSLVSELVKSSDFPRKTCGVDSARDR